MATRRRPTRGVAGSTAGLTTPGSPMALPNAGVGAVGEAAASLGYALEEPVDVEEARVAAASLQYKLQRARAGVGPTVASGVALLPAELAAFDVAAKRVRGCPAGRLAAFPPRAAGRRRRSPLLTRAPFAAEATGGDGFAVARPRGPARARPRGAPYSGGRNRRHALRLRHAAAREGGHTAPQRRRAGHAGV